MTRNAYLLLVCITLLALGLQLHRLDAQSLWLDEASSWRGTQADWPAFVDTNLLGECTPPLYFALLKVWTAVAGDSVAAMRLPSVLCGTLTVALLGWFVGRCTGPGPACLAALLLAVAPFHIEYSQEARPYALFTLLILAATASLGWALETGTAKRWALYAILALLACYTHYFTAFFLAGHGVFIALVCWQEKRLRPGRDWVLSMIAVGLGFLPWLPFMARTNFHSVQWLQDYLRQWTPLMQIWVTIKALIFGGTYPLPCGNNFADAVIVLVAFLVICQLCCVICRLCPVKGPMAGDQGHTRTLFAVMTAVPFLAAWLFSQFRPSLMARYVIPTLPFAMALLALGNWRVRWVVPRVVLAASLVVYLLMCLQNQMDHPSHPELRQAAAHIADQLKAGDGIVVESWEHHLVLSYYLRERMPPMVNDYGWPEQPDAAVLAARMAPFRRVWHVRVGAKPCPIEKYLEAKRYPQAVAAQAFFRVPVVKVYAIHD